MSTTSSTWLAQRHGNQVSEVIFVFTVDHGSQNDVHLFSMSLLKGDEITHSSLGAELTVSLRNEQITSASRLKASSKVGTDNKIDLGGSEGLECRNVGIITPLHPFGHVVIVLASGLPERRILR